MGYNPTNWDENTAITPARLNNLEAGVEDAHEEKVDRSTQINPGTGLLGGGDLSQDRTLSFSTSWGDDRYLQQGDADDRYVQQGNGATLYHGFVNDDGSTGFPFPSGWSIEKATLGIYVLHHDLGTTGYTVTVVPIDSPNRSLRIENRQSNRINIAFIDSGNAFADASFMFQLIVNG